MPESLVFQRKGRLFKASGQFPWMQSHSATPVPFLISPEHLRIYFATRDGRNKAQVAYFDFNPQDPGKLEFSKQPILMPGASESFFKDGIYPSSVIRQNNELWMYCSCRRNIGDSFEMTIGLAKSKDNGLSFELETQPVLGKDNIDPWIVSTPYVLRDQNQWTMWYLSGQQHDPISRHSTYNIKKASSLDGIQWVKLGETVIDFLEDENNLSSPCVLPVGDQFKMWFSSAAHHRSYEIRQARSIDCESWDREDLKWSGKIEEWESRSPCYAQALILGDKILLFYSGNQNGRDGLGWAVAKL